MSDYQVLTSLRSHPGFQLLQALWAKQGVEIMNKMQKAAAKPQESAWRYFAGQMQGFDLAIGQLDRALVDMEREQINTREEIDVEKVINQIRGTKDNSL